ncbi:FAD/NAD(P)-dependent oxidoreductase [Aminobacter aminovorans]|uniref:(2Fe-2S)-binding protein n=1 Tax=Aminobacter aminovorans TaxID=83263 RepID=A0AAC8YW55_AMIAI|nr:FAD/NAD(P)-binding oxidoreductase [Aminobacter aminovorans]AMS45323.1 (2Fe-2S)-binding protein [Aminobacter aminovorans]MBB3708926.1 NADPH-dependent 2,4-dienoyl-CoA reductase/sulfur reductase-like enzyme [Aminobacter aminovorans]
MTAKLAYDVVVIGAGPAGIAAATTAAKHGMSVLMLDEWTKPGGQIYRNIGGSSSKLRRVLGSDYERGDELLRGLAATKIEYRPQSTVWSLGKDGSVNFLSNGASHVAQGQRIVVATGAQERPFPLEGWDIPGVMTVGAAQTLLKSSGMVAKRAALIGSGPLLWLLADQYCRAGHPPVAIVETTSGRRLRSAIPALPRFLSSPYALKGLRLLWRVKRSVPVYTRAERVKIVDEQGSFRIFFDQGNKKLSILAEHAFLHLGVMPQINLPNALGCKLTWNDYQRCWDVLVDTWGRTSLDNIFMAGDGVSIGGAEIAHARGVLAGLACARDLARIDGCDLDLAAIVPRRTITNYSRGRTFLDRLYRPETSFLVGTPNATACRCEDISVGQIQIACSELRPAGANQMKAFLRCGMGPCQGRFCGSTVAAIAAAQTGATDESGMDPYRHRFPIKPVTVGDLSAGEYSPSEKNAVARA